MGKRDRVQQGQEPVNHGRAPSQTFDDSMIVETDAEGDTTGSSLAGPPELSQGEWIESGTIDYETPDGSRNVRQLGDRTAIGRHTENDIQLLDPEVSKQHLVIERKRGCFYIRDLGSANGTLVNGIEVDSMPLTDGDMAEVGNSTLRFHFKKHVKKEVKKHVKKHVKEHIKKHVKKRGPSVSSNRKEPHSHTDEHIPEFPPYAEIETSSLFEDESHDDNEDEDRTIVTLIPMAEEVPETTNVFAVSMLETFAPAPQNDLDVLRRDYERLRVAFDLSGEVGLQKDLPTLADTIIKRICEVLPHDTAVMMLRDESGGLVPLASATKDDRAEVRIPRAIVEKVIRSREGLLTTDAQADAAFRSSQTVVGQCIRSALCVPLVVGEQVYGVLHLSSSSAAGAYEERDLALLRAIAQPAALAVANARLVQRTKEEARTRAHLSRFLSPALVERAVRNDISLDTQGEKVVATVLFSDIRGFTSMSDGAAPEQVVSMLNEYFEAMVEVVFQHGGTLDKFIGDGMMAVWGTPVQTPADAAAAVGAAYQMREVLDSVVNRVRRARGEAPLSVGWGVATGQVVAGGIGARRRQDFTVIGDTVNLSSRLCSHAAPGQILLCHESAKRCEGSGFALASMEPITVKGVARPVPVFQFPVRGS